MVIQRPVSLVPVCPASRDDPYWDEWQGFLDQVDIYNDIAKDVGEWWGELEVWIADNLDAFLAGCHRRRSPIGCWRAGGVAGEVPRGYWTRPRWPGVSPQTIS
jgi:hypothetical protein